MKGMIRGLKCITSADADDAAAGRNQATNAVLTRITRAWNPELSAAIKLKSDRLG